MPRRARRPRPDAVPVGEQACPCGLPQPYAACCGRFHAGAAAPTCELLMRSRFSAYALGDRDHLARSWHPSTRPATVELDPERRWLRLEVLDTVGGGLLESEGQVEFRAHYRWRGRPGVLHERSRFARDQGRWAYLDGTVVDG